jgi:hypothetical protein
MLPAIDPAGCDGELDEPELVTTSAITTRQSAAATETAAMSRGRFHRPQGNRGP